MRCMRCMPIYQRHGPHLGPQCGDRDPGHDREEAQESRIRDVRRPCQHDLQQVRERCQGGGAPTSFRHCTSSTQCAFRKDAESTDEIACCIAAVAHHEACKDAAQYQVARCNCSGKEVRALRSIKIAIEKGGGLMRPCIGRWHQRCEASRKIGGRTVRRSPQKQARIQGLTGAA